MEITFEDYLYENKVTDFFNMLKKEAKNAWKMILTEMIKTKESSILIKKLITKKGKLTTNENEMLKKSLLNIAKSLGGVTLIVMPFGIPIGILLAFLVKKFKLDDGLVPA
jgi:hypothetical protein